MYFIYGNLNIAQYIYKLLIHLSGCYLLLFGTCVYMMSSRQQDNARHNHNLFLIVTFFVLSTFLVADYTTVKVNASIIHFNAVRTGDYEPLIKYLMHDVKKTVLLYY
jgi:bacteriorhodopsin